MSSTAATCPLCQISHLVTISMSVNGRDLTLHSCNRCETKWWKADGENVGIKTVLDTAATRRTA